MHSHASTARGIPFTRGEFDLKIFYMWFNMFILYFKSIDNKSWTERKNVQANFTHQMFTGADSQCSSLKIGVS